MKSLFVISALLAATTAIDPEFIKEVRAHIKGKLESCAKEVNASPADLEALMAHQVPESHEGKCILFCLHKGCQVQNEDGSLNIDAALQGLEMFKEQDMEVYEKLVATFKSCASTPADPDPCVFATNLAKCVVETGKANGLHETFVE